MKFLQIKFRGKQSEWFAKRGITWHLCSVIVKKGGKLEVSFCAHLLNSCSQDWFAVPSILEQLITVLKIIHSTITKVYLRSDEAGCYHNNSLLAALREEVVTELTLWDIIFRNHSTIRMFATAFYARWKPREICKTTKHCGRIDDVGGTFECPHPQCSKEFLSRAELETHLSVTADHSPVKTVQRSVYDHLGIDWVQRFQSISLDFKRKSRL